MLAGGQSLGQSASSSLIFKQVDQSKVPEAVTQPDKLRTEFGEGTVLRPSTNAETDGVTDTARTVKTHFGQVRLLDSRQAQSVVAQQVPSSQDKQAQPAGAKQDRRGQAPAASVSKHSQQPLQSVKTEFGEVRILGEPIHSSPDMRLLPGACMLLLPGRLQQLA